jgi:short-subunit dehydrogenase
VAAASQQQAVEAAQSYLQMGGFSRQGLIDQLSSSAGEGFPLQDATAAVDSLSVNWNAQAVTSAKSYLKMGGFSCQGLIEQLSSSAGEQFTAAQAQYAATKVGLC